MDAIAQLRLRDTLKRMLRVGETTYSDLLESGAISHGSLTRVISDAGEPVTLAQLDRLAHALGLEPWQLLHPEATPKRLRRVDR